MNLRSLDIPDEPDELAGWLQGELAGWRLAELAAELAAVQPQLEPAPPLTKVVGPHAADVLASGLSALPPAALQTLLVHPSLLLELQRWLLEEGSPYWLEWFQAGRVRGQILQGTRQQLREWLAADRPAAQAAPARSLGWRAWLAPLAAAFLLAAAGGYLYWMQRGIPTAWGWNRPDVLAADVPTGAYLDRLADAAQQWFDQEPQTADALAERLSAMRLGCTRLILAEHTPLAAADRAWLKERCGVWASKLDKNLADLEAGADPVAVRADVDETVRKLADALRARSRLALSASDGPVVHVPSRAQQAG
jgi:hypothetical protein